MAIIESKRRRSEKINSGRDNPGVLAPFGEKNQARQAGVGHKRTRAKK